MASYFQPGNINIKEISITNFRGEEFDLQGIFTEVNIYEDLFTSTLSGSIFIEDGIDLFQNLPIIGEEKVTIRFTTSDEGFDTIVVQFNVFQVTNFNHMKSAVTTYQLELVSPEFLLNTTTYVERSLRQSTGADIKSILQSELQSAKTIDVRDYTREYPYIPARQRPFEVIATLLNRSHLRTNLQDTTGILYEDVDGFKLQSLLELTNNTEVIANYTYRPKNLISNQTAIEGEFYSFNALLVDNNVEALAQVSTGALGGTVAVFDPITRSYKEQVYDYQLTSNIANNKLYTGDNNLVKNATKSHMRFVTKGTKDRSYSFRNQFLMQHFNGIRYRLEVPGNSSLRIGQLVELNIPSRTGEDIEQQRFDRFYSGNYLITSLKHTFTPAQTSYSTTIEVVSAGYRNNPEKTSLINRLQYDTR